MTTTDRPSPKTELGDLESCTEPLAATKPFLPDAATLAPLRARAAENAAMHRAMAEIAELGKTDAHAADAMLQRLARDREIREAASPHRAFQPHSTAEWLGELDDLVAAVDEPDHGTQLVAVAAVEAVEDQEELDAAVDEALAYEAVRGDTAHVAMVHADYGELKISATSAPTDKMPSELLELIQKTRIKYGPRPEIASSDPLATDKAKVSNFLKRYYGKTLDVLQPGFWDEPDKEARGRLLGEVVGQIIAEKRFAKRVERSIAAGYPAGYHSLPENEQRKIGNALRQRRFNAKKPVCEPKLKTALPTPTINREWIADSLARLKKWTANSDATAVQYRGREIELVKARTNHKSLTKKLGREPTQSELSVALNCTRRVAQTRIKRIHQFEAVGGPWYDKPLDS